MATLPVDDLRITEGFGPHLSSATGIRLSTSVEPDRLVKTHCCFCGQQCGIQLKVKDNQVIGFEPWEEFPVQPRHALPEGCEALPAGLASGSADDRGPARPVGCPRVQPDAV